MPELPEVGTVVRNLLRRLVGRRLASAEVSDLPLRILVGGVVPTLTGRRIQTRVGRSEEGSETPAASHGKEGGPATRPSSLA
jgi:formamidopyrimidine-DNA glycosylase